MLTASSEKNRTGDPGTGVEKSTVASEDAAATTGDTGSSDRAFRASVSQACSGTSVEFKVEHMPENGIYLWNFGDGSFSNKANPEHTFTKPGRYQVMLSMSASGVGSIQNKPSSDVIEIHEAPSAAFNVLRQEYEGHLPSVHFENRSLGGESYAWDFGDGETSTIAHPDHIYKTKGVYQVKLTVTNAIGCEDQIMKDVRVDRDYNLDAPASFSPDGDGKDESFIPEALRSLGVKFNLTIYSPNGTLLYQTNDATKPWTGRPSNRGDICAPGEYVWVVDVRESLHLAETYTGKVKLER
jgi:PKD repeat protein